LFLALPISIGFSSSLYPGGPINFFPKHIRFPRTNAFKCIMLGYFALPHQKILRFKSRLVRLRTYVSFCEIITKVPVHVSWFTGVLLVVLLSDFAIASASVH